MKKLKFKHPSEANLPHEDLVVDYDIRFFDEEMIKRLSSKIELSKNFIGSLSYINNNWAHSLVIDCPVEITYTISWTSISKDIDINDIISTLMDDEFYPSNIMNMPGGGMSYHTGRQVVMIYSMNESYIISTIVNIEKHPFMIKLYREWRLNKLL